jgi:hypothetical protein
MIRQFQFSFRRHGHPCVWDWLRFRHYRLTGDEQLWSLLRCLIASGFHTGGRICCTEAEIVKEAVCSCLQCPGRDKDGGRDRDRDGGLPRRRAFHGRAATVRSSGEVERVGTRRAGVVAGDA